MAGAPPISPISASLRNAGLVAQHRGDDAQSFGDVLDDEANHQEGAQGDLADVVRRADRQPFAQVVEADANRDHERNGKRWRSASLPVTAAWRLGDRIQQQEGCHRADADQADALECGTAPSPQLSSASAIVSSPRKISRPAVSRHQEGHRAASQLAQRREPEDAQERPG